MILIEKGERLTFYFLAFTMASPTDMVDKRKILKQKISFRFVTPYVKV
jgi:hypothetical protein